MAMSKKQDFFDNAGSRGKNADDLHTISTMLAVTLIILQAFVAGCLAGVIIFLFLEGF